MLLLRYYCSSTFIFDFWLKVAVTMLQNKLLAQFLVHWKPLCFHRHSPMHDRAVDITMPAVQQCVHVLEVYPNPVPRSYCTLHTLLLPNFPLNRSALINILDPSFCCPISVIFMLHKIIHQLYRIFASTVVRISCNNRHNVKKWYIEFFASVRVGNLTLTPTLISAFSLYIIYFVH